MHIGDETSILTVHQNLEFLSVKGKGQVEKLTSAERASWTFHSATLHIFLAKNE
jgi:hypothetical protein